MGQFKVMHKALNNQNQIGSMLKKANRYLNKNDLSSAKSTLESVLVLDSQNTTALVLLGKLYLVKKDFAKGLAFATSAMKIASSDLSVAKAYAEALSHNGKWEEAESIYFQMNNAFPSDEEVIRGLAFVYSQTNDSHKLFFVYMSLLTNNLLKESDVENLHYCLGKLFVNEYSESMEKNAIQLLTNGFVNPEKVQRFASTLIIEKYKLGMQRWDAEIETVLNDELLLLCCEKFVFKVPVVNRFIREIREKLLYSVIHAHHQQTLLHENCLYVRALRALAINSWHNEYIEYASDDELKSVERLKADVRQILGESDSQLSISSFDALSDKILAIGMYESLLEFEELMHALNHVLLPESHDLYWLVCELKNELTEKKLALSMKVLTTIDDEVSNKVKQQYEENPYPRWQQCHSNHYHDIFDLIQRETGRMISSPRKFTKKSKVLIAGCGTGREVVLFAKAFKHPITAIDMSSRSLAYAKRKAKEKGVGHVKFAMADLLKINELDQTFDIIFCNGVLHHLADPMKGWKALTDQLNPGGFMRISLYSQLARQDINIARELITGMNLQSSVESIRQFRFDLFNGKYEAFRPKENFNLCNGEFFDLSDRGDFSTLSNCRDLLFHVQERQYSILEIQECLKELNLSFVGFSTELHRVKNKSTFFAEESNFYDLTCWSDYENSYPSFFAGMYQFWLQKL